MIKVNEECDLGFGFDNTFTEDNCLCQWYQGKNY